MATIQLRMSEPTGDTESATQDDVLDALLADERKAVASIPTDDPYRPDLAPPAAAHLTACERARRIPWRALDYHRDRMAAAATVLQDAQKNAAASVPTFGHGSPEDYQAAVSGARRQAEASAARSISVETVARFEEKGQQAAQSYLDTFKVLCDAFDQAFSDWNGPAALSDKHESKLEDLYAADSVEKELRSYPQPMMQSRQLLQSIIRSGNLKKLDLFTRAARSLALEIKSTPQPKLAAMLNNRGSRDMADSEREHAFGLLADLDQLRAQTRPPSLLTIGNVIGQSRLFCQQLFGVNPAYTIPAEFLIRGQPINSKAVDRGKTQQSIENKWFQRYLPGDGGSLRLPGWTPIAFRSSTGAVSRRPQ